MTDVIQMFGQIVQDPRMRGLGVFLYEKWVRDISLDDYNTGDLADLDCPRTTELGTKSSAQQRVRYWAANLIQSFDCIRSLFAHYLSDKTLQGDDDHLWNL